MKPNGFLALLLHFQTLGYALELLSPNWVSIDAQ